LPTTNQTSQVTSQRLIVSTDDYTSTGEQTTSFFNSTIVSTTALRNKNYKIQRVYFFLTYKFICC